MDSRLLPAPHATHYDILGVPPGERDPQVLEEAALRHSARARACQLGRPEEATALLRRIALALATLIDPVRRAAYDAALEAVGPALTASVLGSALMLLRAEENGQEQCTLWAISFRKVPLDAAQRREVMERVRPDGPMRGKARFARIVRRKTRKGRSGQILLAVIE